LNLPRRAASALSRCTGSEYTKYENETHDPEAVGISRHDVANGFTGLQTDDGLHKGCSVGRSSAGAEPGDDVALAAASASHACSASEQTHPELMINFFARLRRRFRCFWRTGGMHELDISTGKCRFCRIDWDRLYKTNRPSDNS